MSAANSAIPDTSAESQKVSHSLLLSLVGVMAVAASVVIGVGWGLFGLPLWLGLIAFGVGLASTVAAQFAGSFPKGDEYFAVRLGVQMAARTLLPLTAAIIGVNFLQPPLVTGLVLYIFSFYVVGTALDVAGQVRRLQQLDS